MTLHRSQEFTMTTTTTSSSPRFLHLRVKLASLVSEARIIIRREEQRALHAELYLSLRGHRRSVVGGEARLTHLALTALRGRASYPQAEPKTDSPPDLTRLRKLLYMLTDDRSRIEAWLAAADQHLVAQGYTSQRAPSAHQQPKVSAVIPQPTR
jgi:hypothetical protein